MLRALGSVSTASASVTLTAGSAADLDTTLPLAVSYGDGDTVDTVQVALCRDTVADEGCKTVTLTLASPSGASIGVPASMDILIEEREFTSAQLGYTYSSTLEVRQHC